MALRSVSVKAAGAFFGLAMMGLPVAALAAGFSPSSPWQAGGVVTLTGSWVAPGHLYQMVLYSSDKAPVTAFSTSATAAGATFTIPASAASGAYTISVDQNGAGTVVQYPGSVTITAGSGGTSPWVMGTGITLALVVVGAVIYLVDNNKARTAL